MTDLTDLTRFTDGSIAGRQQRLPGALRDLHRAVLRRFLETGAPHSERWLLQAAADTGLDASALVEMDGLPAVYAMCAIDALGLPAMARRDGIITSADPHDGTPITVTARGGTGSWNPATAVVVAGRITDCGTERSSFETMCPNTVFHASAQNARAYLASHGGLDAEILDHDTALECGRLNFGTLLFD